MLDDIDLTLRYAVTIFPNLLIYIQSNQSMPQRIGFMSELRIRKQGMGLGGLGLCLYANEV